MLSVAASAEDTGINAGGWKICLREAWQAPSFQACRLSVTACAMHVACLAWNPSPFEPCSPLIEVEFRQLSCDFESDTCFWFVSGNATWQFAAGHADDGSMSLEVTGNETDYQSFSLESTRFSAASRQGLMFFYQVMGSSSAAVKLQAQQAGTWSTIFQKAGDNRSAVSDVVTIAVPDGTVALRFLASVAAAEVVRLDSLMPVVSLADISCGFERGACGWSGDFQRSDFSAFRGCCAWAATSLDLEVRMFRSPWFWPTAGTVHLGFAYEIWAVEDIRARLELQYFLGEEWRAGWLRKGEAPWQQAKVTLPAGTRRLRFVGTGRVWAELTVDEVVAWESEGQASEAISLCSGEGHNCAAHLKSGQVKCWGYGAVGDGPNEMGLSLPAVDLGGAIRQLGCGSLYLNCAVFEDGKLKCWAGTNLPPIDLGTGAIVESVAVGGLDSSICALLRSGDLKCFSFDSAHGPAPELVVGWQF